MCLPTIYSAPERSPRQRRLGRHAGASCLSLGLARMGDLHASGATMRLCVIGAGSMGSLCGGEQRMRRLVREGSPRLRSARGRSQDQDRVGPGQTERSAAGRAAWREEAARDRIVALVRRPWPPRVTDAVV